MVAAERDLNWITIFTACSMWTSVASKLNLYNLYSTISYLIKQADIRKLITLS